MTAVQISPGFDMEGFFISNFIHFLDFFLKKVSFYRNRNRAKFLKNAKNVWGTLGLLLEGQVYTGFRIQVQGLVSALIMIYSQIFFFSSPLKHEHTPNS